MNNGQFQTKTPREYKKECKSMNVIPLDDYQGTHSKIKYKCISCNSTFVKSPSWLKTQFNKGKACYNCWRKPVLNNKRHAYINELCRKKKLTVVAYPETSKYSDKGKFHCDSCEHTFETTVCTIRNSKHCCPKFARRNFKKACTNKKYKLGNKIVYLQGYEPQAIDILISSGYEPNEIVTQGSGSIPTIQYKHRDKLRKHYPDVYIPSEKLIFEVKSNATFGLNNEILFNENKAKRLAAIKQGYRYEFIVIYQKGSTKATKGKPKKYHYAENPLVSEWYNLTFKQFVKQMKATSFYVSVGDNFYTAT